MYDHELDSLYICIHAHAYEHASRLSACCVMSDAHTANLCTCVQWSEMQNLHAFV